jgi:hypothetical protein
MDALSVIAPLIGVVLGSALSGLGAYFKHRGERKQTIAIALSDLLEIRHRLVAIDVILGQIRARVDVPPEVMPALRNFFDSFLLPNDGLDDRYNNAISLLAGIDPLLAFSLRSKNTFPRLLGSLRNLAIGSGANLKEFESLESTLRLAVAPNLNAAAIELARHHSWFTRHRVQRLVQSTGAIPSEVTQLLDQLKTLPSTTTPNG